MDNFLKMFEFEDLESFNDALLQFTGKLIVAVIILLVARFVVMIGNACIHGVMSKNRRLKRAGVSKFSNFETMFKTLFKYFIYIIAILTIFTKVFELIDATSIITTLGVGGVALSFGAQSLVKDIISGFFILVEKQMEPGDYIILGEISGTVKELDLRCVKIETYKGEMVYIPYGEIRQLVNKSKIESSIVVDIPVSYKQNVDEILNVATEIAGEYTHKDLKSKLDVLSPVSLDEKTYLVRIYGKCKACSDWEIERDLRKLIVEKVNQKKMKLGFDIEVN